MQIKLNLRPHTYVVMFLVMPKEDFVLQKYDLLIEKLYQNLKNKKIPNSKPVSEFYFTLKT
jgi:hypothetical protein